VDLEHPALLAQDGLAPSEGNPQFHQQMVYAVAMRTIRHFEQALGRRALWSSRLWREGEKKSFREEFVRRLRVYPHALREANAYYSPEKKALLLGYFPAEEAPAEEYPEGMVFTCLSHDIIAHETTHALLDGMHRRLIEASNPDVLAFHEAFADIVALFQHFTMREVLRHEIARSRGELRTDTLLGQLAHQFGRATGSHGALRDAIGTVVDGAWVPTKPDPARLRNTWEPHDRGAILVAAVFDAFVSIYDRRIQDLLRIATGGTGILPLGQIAPDLVTRLAEEAARTAGHVLSMCIRALDYLPPVDVTFGEYLRALITADTDLVPNDDRQYRVAVIEAFRRRGIYPDGLRVLSEDALRWQRGTTADLEAARFPFALELQRIAHTWSLSGDGAEDVREQIYRQTKGWSARLHRWLSRQRAEAAGPLPEATALGLDLTLDLAADAPFEVHSLRPARRVSPDNATLTDLVVVITQQKKVPLYPEQPDGPTFLFRGGSTLIVDQETTEIRYVIYKRISSKEREQRQREFLQSQLGGTTAFSLWSGEGRDADYTEMLRQTYFADEAEAEPFAFLHRMAPSPGRSPR
jgi:hypothetical protein